MEEKLVIANETATQNTKNKDMLDCDELLSQNKMELTNKEVSSVQEITHKEVTVNKIGEGECEVAKGDVGKLCEDDISRGFKRQTEKEELIKGLFFKGTMEIEEVDEERMQNVSCSSVSLKEEKLTQQIIAESDKTKGSLKRKKIIESDEEENDDESYNEDTEKDSKTKKRKLNGNNLLAVLGLTQWNAQPGGKHEIAASEKQAIMKQQTGSKKRKSAVQKDDRKEYPSEGKVTQRCTEKENVQPIVGPAKGDQVQKLTKDESTAASHQENEIQTPKPKRKYSQRKKPAAKAVTVANKEEQEFMQNVLEFLEDGKPQPKRKAPANSRRKNDNSFIEKIEQKCQAEAAQLEQEKLKRAIQEQQEVILKQKLAVEEQQRQLQVQIQLRAEKQLRLEQQQKQQTLLSKQKQKQGTKQEQEQLEEEKATILGRQEPETGQLDNQGIKQNQQSDGKVEEQVTQISNTLLEDQQQQLSAANDSELLPVIGNVKSEPIKDIVPLIVKQEALQQQQQQHQFSYPQVLPPQLIQQQFMMMQQNMQLQALFQQLQQTQQNPQFPFLIQQQPQQAQQQPFVQNGAFISPGMQQGGGMILPNQQLVFNQAVEMERQEQFEVKDEDEQHSISSNIPQIPVTTHQQSTTKSTTPQVQLEQIKEEDIEEEQEVTGKPKKQAPKRTKKPQQPKVLEDSFDGEQIVQDVPKSKAKTKARFSTKKLHDSSPDDTLDEEYTGNVKAPSRSKQTTEKAHNKPSYRESDLKILQGKSVKTEDIPDKKKHTKSQDKTVESNSSKVLVEDQKKNGNTNENQLFEQNDKFLKLMQKYSKPTTAASEKENKNPVVAKTIPSSSSSSSKIDNFIENIQKSKGSQPSATSNSSKETPSQQPEDELKAIENLPKIGHFRYGDKPSEIISSRIINGIIYIEIEWKPRINQFRPSTSIISTEEIKLFDKDFLIEYYESKILKSNSSKASNVSSKSKADILHKIQNSSVAYTSLVNNKNNNTNGTSTAGSLAQQSKKEGENGTKDSHNNNDLGAKNTQNASTNSGNGQQKRKQIDLMSEKTFQEEIDEEDANEIKQNAEKQQLNAEKEKDNSDSNGAFYENPYEQFMIEQGALGGYDSILAKNELTEKDKDNKRVDKNSKGKEQLKNEKPKDGEVVVVITEEGKIIENEKQQSDVGQLNGKSKENEDEIDKKSNVIDVQTAGTVITKNPQNNLDTGKKEINDCVRMDDTKMNQIKEKPLTNLNDQIEEEYEINMNKSY